MPSCAEMAWGNITTSSSPWQVLDGATLPPPPPHTTKTQRAHSSPVLSLPRCMDIPGATKPGRAEQSRAFQKGGQGRERACGQVIAGGRGCRGKTKGREESGSKDWERQGYGGVVCVGWGWGGGSKVAALVAAQCAHTHWLDKFKENPTAHAEQTPVSESHAVHCGVELEHSVQLEEPRADAYVPAPQDLGRREHHRAQSR